MPPKSLQPSAVGGKQTPGRVFKPKQDASFDPRANSLKLPALRADVPAPTAVKTPVLYPASSFVLGSCHKTAENFLPTPAVVSTPYLGEKAAHRR